MSYFKIVRESLDLIETKSVKKSVEGGLAGDSEKTREGIYKYLRN